MNFTKTAIATAVIASVIGLAGCNDDDDNTSPSFDTSNLKYVDPFIGTGFNGHTFPGPVVPEGMVQLSPDTELIGWHLHQVTTSIKRLYLASPTLTYPARAWAA